jgi:hypothetical protein
MKDSDNVRFIISQNSESCGHSDSISYSILLDGSESCEDGILTGRFCTSCGYISSANIQYTHRTTTESINLSENGACYGEIIYETCPCGENLSVYVNNGCFNNWTGNEYYDDEQRLIHVDVATCSICGLRYTNSYYKVKEEDSCKITYYHTAVINIGDKLIAEYEYTSVGEEHDCDNTYTLIGGEGSSCKDGVQVTEKCKYCDFENIHEIWYHERFEIERVDLSECGSVCGGYAVVYSCPCGAQTTLDINSHGLCEFGSENCEVWIKDIITESQLTIEGKFGYSSKGTLYICAVTDPIERACAFKIRYADYWLKDEDSCMAYHYKTWQFGYNEETGEYQYELTLKIGNGRTYHNYVDSSADGNLKYDCPDCGSYYYENDYYDNNNGGLIKSETIIANKLDDGNAKYRENTVEYAISPDGNRYESRVYNKYIYADGTEFWNETLRSEKAYVGTFGENGREITSFSEDSNGNVSSEAHAYVYYKSQEYAIYSEKSYDGYTERWDYTHTFDDGCMCTVIYTNSNGEKTTDTYENCHSFYGTLTKAPTCTQDGEQCLECMVCGKQRENQVVPPHDHNWVWVASDWYYCFNCGLENTNGVSGDIVMEDLTDSYGNDEYYVVGYYSQNNVEFSQYISLILADGTEVAIFDGIDFIELDGIRAFAFSKAAVEAWATEKGYTDYEVRFSFVPVGSDGSFDYGITFSEPMYATDTIVDSVSFTDYIAADETKSYTITPTEDSVWTFISYTYNYAYASLYDANGNELSWSSGFEINYDLKAGETYVLQVGWYYNTAGNIGLIFTKDAK